MEEENTIIRKSKWSVCYRQGNTFVKEYVYPDTLAIQREILASKVVWKFGIITPKFIDSKTQNGTISSYFEYYDITPLNINFVIKNPMYIEQIKNILVSFEKIVWNSQDSYWFNQLKDFENALSYLNDDTSKIMDFLRSLVPEIFIHGDFTCDNIGVVSQEIIVYDFQHGSLGPIGWDKSYMASTMSPVNSNLLLLDSNELKMAFAVSAIRYGRGIRKSSSDLPKRQSLYLLWKDFVKC